METSMQNFRVSILKRMLLFLFGFFVLLGPCLTWGQDVGLLVSPGKLSQVHANLSGVKNCEKCHTEGKKTDIAKCLDCHKELASRMRAGTGYHRDKQEDCITCHPEHHGEAFKLIEFDIKTFDHAETGYRLKGLHKAVTDCRRCHHKATMVPGKTFFSYLLADTRCIACHKDVHQGQLGDRCEKCHSVDRRFNESRLNFNHDASSYPLKGAHRNVACENCHPERKWKGLRFSRCSDCHRDPHRPSFNDRCSSCHNETSWKAVTAFDHNRTAYPLRGKHKNLTCRQCHPAGKKYRKMSFANCRDCHRNDPHKGQFKQDCQGCHVVQGFKKSTYDHRSGNYPLTGKHRSVACSKCHNPRPGSKTVVYKPLGTACNDCHNDVHKGQFKKTCGDCHVTAGFKREHLTFEHRRDSTYPLEGKHAAVSCEKCHLKKAMQFPAGAGEAVLYRPLDSACITCHRDFHRGQLGNRCRQCHTVASFKSIAAFDHQRTRFPLDRIHDAVECVKCHPRVRVSQGDKVEETIKFKPIGTQCMVCHKDLNHDTTAFGLTGKHLDADCSRCHNAGTPNTRRTRKTPAGSFQCRNCHRSPHPGGQPLCAQCHTTRNWRVDAW